MSRQPFSVSELTAYIKDTIENDMELSSVLVSGEISNFKYHSSGHMYFTLKDDDSKIKCVMFRGQNLFLKFIPKDGMNVIITGYISVYERDGQYQLYCNTMQPDGMGSLYLAFEQLKEKLYKEGLFDEDKKKPIPLLPQNIGVITSPTGAVIRDIINVSTRRFRNIRITLYPVKVQGEGAKESIAEAIEYFNSRDDIDVIILGRGGGSIEELWAFNEEIVAREIGSSRIPVISAVGHETDFTIADFAADLRASTPSHAAEMAVPSYDDLKYKIESIKNEIISRFEDVISGKKCKVNDLLQIIKSESPENIIAQNIQYVDNLQFRIVSCMQNKMNSFRNRFGSAAGRLDGLSPMKTLSRGYVYIEKEGRVVKSVRQLSKNENINLHLGDGLASCRVIDIMEDRHGKQEN